MILMSVQAAIEKGSELAIFRQNLMGNLTIGI